MFTQVPGANHHLVSVIQLVIAFVTGSVCLPVVGCPGGRPGGGEGGVVSCLSTSRQGGLNREIL